MLNISASPSRTYVAICSVNGQDDRSQFRKFKLPEPGANVFPAPHPVRNDSGFALAWFQAVLEEGVFVEACVSFEEYKDLKEVTVAIEIMPARAE